LSVPQTPQVYYASRIARSVADQLFGTITLFSRYSSRLPRRSKRHARRRRRARSSSAPTGTALALLKTVAGGTSSATGLARELGLSQPRVSYLAAALLKGRWLKKIGAKYDLTKRAETLVSTEPAPAPSSTKNITAETDPPTASGSAPAKEEKVSEQTEVPHGQDGLDRDFEGSARHGAQIPKSTIQPTLAPVRIDDSDQVTRQSWAAYRSPDTISQQTGVPARLMRRSDVKELTDNGLDLCDLYKLYGLTAATLEGPNTYTVVNQGPGWQKTPEEFAHLLSLARGESISSKLWRKPLRGALGHGLMGVVGTVASGGGRITIKSCNQRVVLKPSARNGNTSIEEVTAIDYPVGTSITIEIDPAYPEDPHALYWAQVAIGLAKNGGSTFNGRPSSHWFDIDAFSLLLIDVNPAMTLLAFAKKVDGGSQDALRKKIIDTFGRKRLCRTMEREEALRLLRILRSATKPINAKRLGLLGRGAWPNYPGGYDYQIGSFTTGPEELPATIPFLAECWAVSSDSSNDNVKIGGFTVNRTPIILDPHSHRKKGREAVLYLGNCWIRLSIPQTQIEFALNLTSPFIPLLSTGKAPDLSPFRDVLKRAIETAIARAYRATHTPAPRRIQQEDLAPAGSLRSMLENAVFTSGYEIDELTVLSKDRDPYRLDTAQGRSNGQWFAEMIERFLEPEGTVHLRGLHYWISSSADVSRPDGRPYVNDNDTWEWLSNEAAKAARWLGYVSFDRIVDERNAPPELYLPPYFKVEPEHNDGEQIIIPSLEEALPQLTSVQWPLVQPYRIILLGEKTSLKKVLLPIAQMVGGELLLPTGEASDTMIAELAGRCSLDSRPSVVLYFSDFDPSGYQMPVSVARKLQALKDLRYPLLDIRLHHVALNLDQVRNLALPSTPLKPSEKRADRWRAAMRHEQTEIDALAALRPEELRTIALEAVKPFYDPTLAQRIQQAEARWREQCKNLIGAQRAFQEARQSIELILETARQAAGKLEEAQTEASSILQEVEPPPIELPPAQIDSLIKEPTSLFNSRDNFVRTSRRLLQRKRLAGEEGSEFDD
jgi:hypothetical protein